MPKSKNQEHITPDRVFDLIEEEFDIKKFYFTDQCPVGTPFRSPCFFNSLNGDWDSVNYVNPPYEVRTLEKFVEKAIQQSRKARISVMLLPCKTDQDWFHDLILENHYQIRFIRKRLKFKNNKDGSTGSHFIVMIE